MAISEFGRIGRDAELRYTQNGDAVCSVPVAVEYGRKGQDGKRPVQWYDAVLWGKQAEGLAPYLLKGKQIFFEASDLRIEQYTRNDGAPAAKLVCRMNAIKFASDSTSAAPQQAQQAQPQRQQPAQRPQQSQQAAPPDDFSDDIPFLGLHWLNGI